MLTLLLACTGSEPTTPADSAATETGAPDTADSGETTPPTVTVTDVSVTLSETIAAVAVVTFAAEGEGEGAVIFGEQDAEARYRVAATEQDDGTWRAVLVGVPAESTGWLQVGLGEVFDETVHTYETGSAPEWLTTELSGKVLVEGFYALAVMGKGRGAVIVTTAGEPVWWWGAPAETSGILSRTLLSPDHSTVWFNAFNIESYGAFNDGGQLIGVALDGSSEEVVSLEKTHHDFLIQPDGTVAVPTLDDREVDGKMVRGDAIIEIAPDGTERTVWTSWDAIPYLSQAANPPDWWTMLNHLQWVEESNDYVASFKNLTTLMRIDGTTGETEWIISRDEKIATLTPDDAFRHQHGLHVVSDEELLLFDNDGADGHSRVIRMGIDVDSARAETLAIYDGDVSSLIMGDVVQQDSGELLVCYSSEARLDELTADGEIRSQLSFPTMVNVGYIEHLPAIGLSASRQ